MATEKRNIPGIQERRNGDGSASYRAQIRMRGFPHLSETFTRKTDARRWIEDTKASIRLGNAVSTEVQRTTLREALERYLREITPGKKGARREQDRVKAWQGSPLALHFLSQLRSADFAKHRDQRRAQGRAENTIRIELALISKLYKVASRDWGMEGLRNPIESLTMPGGSNKRERRLTPGEETALMTELIRRGPYMEPLAALAIETAMRQGELLALAWGDINLPKRVARLRDTKNSEPRDVPLSNRALEILMGLPRPLENFSPVFPLKQDDVIRTFKDACKIAGIENLKFHDLRHEAASRLFEKNLNVMEVAAITGHKTLAMLKRYTHLRAEDLARKLG
ncbi:MAG: site-specific integrase [Betaproteobacteria bacterium]|nr:site-specific integrase [Betaproteobacteria bacterium]